MCSRPQWPKSNWLHQSVRSSQLNRLFLIFQFYCFFCLCLYIKYIKMWRFLTVKSQGVYSSHVYTLFILSKILAIVELFISLTHSLWFLLCPADLQACHPASSPDLPAVSPPLPPCGPQQAWHCWHKHFITHRPHPLTTEQTNCLRYAGFKKLIFSHFLKF